MRVLASFAALALLLLPGGCAALNPGPASAGLSSVPQIDNACLLDASTEFERCKAAGIPCAVIAIYYRLDGKTYGHAMLAYEWLDAYSGNLRWVWDNTNQSQSLRCPITAATVIAQQMFADPVSAHVMQQFRP